ncbi:MAG: hypothetical protein WCD89_03445 [Anaerocolumna sp.]
MSAAASAGAIAYGGTVTVNSALSLVSDGISLMSVKGGIIKEGSGNLKPESLMDNLQRVG